MTEDAIDGFIDESRLPQGQGLDFPSHGSETALDVHLHERLVPGSFGVEIPLAAIGEDSRHHDLVAMRENLLPDMAFALTVEVLVRYQQLADRAEFLDPPEGVLDLGSAVVPWISWSISVDARVKTVLPASYLTRRRRSRGTVVCR